VCLICKSCARLLRLTPSVARATRARSRQQGCRGAPFRNVLAWRHALPCATCLQRHVAAYSVTVSYKNLIFVALTFVTATAKFSSFATVFTCCGKEQRRVGAAPAAGWQHTVLVARCLARTPNTCSAWVSDGPIAPEASQPHHLPAAEASCFSRLRRCHLPQQQHLTKTGSLSTGC
jgi:hypothetical protein